MTHQAREKTIKNSSDESVYAELVSLVEEMQEEEVMPSIEDDVQANLNLYERSSSDVPRYLISVSIKRFY